MKGVLAHRQEISEDYFYLFFGGHLVTFLQGYITTGFIQTSGACFSKGSCYLWS